MEYEYQILRSTSQPLPEKNEEEAALHTNRLKHIQPKIAFNLKKVGECTFRIWVAKQHLEFAGDANGTDKRLRS